ncbi:Nif11-like leader peptide family RiPP precursor [Jiella marina]|uniref:Nif11-like leader peptide family RiPP precursor n=1 Tax=Jiella sp. LLJ827 TaxID=2917712 RepID=UPI0021006E12|nr:Nif11-like leader peptide family RiPP precursor [Jiella sp. LLJ827]MCQ0988070.1 Nif11-like leader peptide family RiPP precursor [Jiella sp. LLJ827]
MAMKTLNDFANAMQGDESLARGLAAAIAEKQHDGKADEAFLAYAGERGFDLTARDLAAVRQVAAGESALSDDQLDAVAGGTFSGGPMGVGFSTPFDPVLDWGDGIFKGILD